MHVFGPPNVVEIIHLEQKLGGEGEGACNRIRHVSTTSFTTAKGIVWKTVAAK